MHHTCCNLHCLRGIISEGGSVYSLLNLQVLRFKLLGGGNVGLRTLQLEACEHLMWLICNSFREMDHSLQYLQNKTPFLQYHNVTDNSIVLTNSIAYGT